MTDRPQTPVKPLVEDPFTTPGEKSPKTPFHIYDREDLEELAKRLVRRRSPSPDPAWRTPPGLSVEETQAFRIQRAANKGRALTGSSDPITPTPIRKAKMQDRHDKRTAVLAAALVAVQPKIDALKASSGMSPRRRTSRFLGGRKSQRSSREVRPSTKDSAKSPAEGLLEAPQEDVETEDEPADIGVPNNLGDDDDEDDQVEDWFPEVFDETETRAQRISNDIHLYPGLATKMVHSRGEERTDTVYWAKFERRTLVEIAEGCDPENPAATYRKIGVWADKRQPRPDFLQPGDVIRAVHSVAQNNVNQEYPSPYVRIFEHGPVYSKVRPMIILTMNHEGMVCLPMFSANWIKKRGANNSHKHEYMTVWTKDSKYGSDWRGFTPANGNPLLMIPSDGVTYFKPESFVDVCRPVYVSKSEAIQYNQGMLPPEEFVRLMEVYTYKENLAKSAAMTAVCFRYPVEHPPPTPLPAGFKAGKLFKGEAEKAVRKRYAAYGIKPNDIDRMFL